MKLANRRIRLLAVLLAVLFAVALGRAAWLQAVEGPNLDALAASQQRETRAVPSSRGAISDRVGVELAIGEEATTVYANPREVREPERVAEAVSARLGLDPAEVLAKLTDRSTSFVYLARKADPAAALLLQEQDLPGLGFYPEERRVYPQRKVAAPVVGFAGVDNEGLAGIELAADRWLRGRDGAETIVRDPFGRMLEVVDTKAVHDGADVRLTIDHRLQAQVEEELRRTRAEWGAKGASAVVLDPHTGEILALAQAPGFDANEFGEEPSDLTRLRPITDTYEPGSTFKLVTVAAALEEELVGPNSRYYVPDSIQVADRVIHENEEHPPMSMTVSQILAESSNVGTVSIALDLGKRRLVHWIERFGFGRRTGIDFPGESRGIVLGPRKWTGSTIGTVPLGQGIAVTPIQMAAAFASVANGGALVAPHLVAEVDGQAQAEPERRQVISPGTAQKLLEMMQRVVEEGTGTRAQVPGYTVAGKTGTAAKPEAGGYSDERYVASFVGVVPARAPRLVVLVTVDEPQGDIYGGTVAAPAFAAIASFALQYLDVPPDAPDAPSD